MFTRATSRLGLSSGVRFPGYYNMHSHQTARVGIHNFLDTVSVQQSIPAYVFILLYSPFWQSMCGVVHIEHCT